MADDADLWKSWLKKEEGKEIGKGIAKGISKTKIGGGSDLRGKVVKGFIFFVVIALVAFAAYYLYTWQDGRYATEAKEGFVAVKDKTSGFQNPFDVLLDPDKLRQTYSLDTSEFEETDEVSWAGIKIENFESVRGGIPYGSGEVIQVIIDVLASSGGEEKTLETDCTLENYDGEVSYFPSNKVIIDNLNPEVSQITCQYSDPIYTDRSEEAREAQVRLSYSYNTKAIYRAYFLTQQKKSDLGGEDFFKFYGINDPLLKANNVMESKYTPGPLKVGIGSRSSQPFVEGTDFAYLLVNIEDEAGGNLKRMTDFGLKLPKSIELDDDNNVCSFDLVGADSINQDYNVYELDQDILNEIGFECEKGRLGDGCREDRKQMIYGCNFRVRDLPIEEGDSFYTDFVLDMDYEYETETSTVVTIQSETKIQGN